MEQKEYKTRCSSMQALLWESKIEEVPNPENFWTFTPKKDDLALVDGVEYIYVNKTKGWIKVEEENTEE